MITTLINHINLKIWIYKLKNKTLVIPKIRMVEIFLTNLKAMTDIKVFKRSLLLLKLSKILQ